MNHQPKPDAGAVVAGQRRIIDRQQIIIEYLQAQVVRAAHQPCQGHIESILKGVQSIMTTQSDVVATINTEIIPALRTAVSTLTEASAARAEIQALRARVAELEATVGTEASPELLAVVMALKDIVSNIAAAQAPA